MALLPSEPPHSTAPSAESGKPKDIPDIFKQSWGYQVRNFASHPAMTSMVTTLENYLKGNQTALISIKDIPKIQVNEGVEASEILPAWAAYFDKSNQNQQILIRKDKGNPPKYKLSYESNNEKRHFSYFENEKGEREVEFGMKVDDATRSVKLNIDENDKIKMVSDVRKAHQYDINWTYKPPDFCPVLRGIRDKESEHIPISPDGSLLREIISQNEKSQQKMFSEKWGEHISALQDAKEKVETFIDRTSKYKNIYQLEGSEFFNEQWAQFLGLDMGDHVNIQIANFSIPHPQKVYIFSCTKDGEERTITFKVDDSNTHIAILATNYPYRRSISFDDVKGINPQNLHDRRVCEEIEITDKTWKFDSSGKEELITTQDAVSDDNITSFDHSLRSLFP